MPGLRRLLAACSIALACAAQPTREHVAAPSVAVPADPRLAWLDLFDRAGLPDVRGWQRIEQVFATDSEGRPRCRRGWARDDHGHHIVLTDELDIDWDGRWFAQWPMHMRVAKAAYRDVALPVRAAKATVLGGRQDSSERPSDLVADVTATLAGRDGCASSSTHSVASVLARASWIRALGHAELAIALLERSPSWKEDWVRDHFATTLLEVALEGLRQGLPRARVRELLARAREVARGERRTHAEQLAALVGDDPLAPAASDDPEALVEWLPDDLLYPLTVYEPQRARDELGWPDDRIPRSPALELVVLGWAALPALLDRELPPRLMRSAGYGVAPDGTLQTATTSAVIRRVASSIALVPFEDDAAMRRWWAAARPRTELAMRGDQLRSNDAYLGLVAVRILELDPVHGVDRIVGAWPELDDARRGELVAAVVEAAWPSGSRRRRLDADAIAELDALAKVAKRSRAIEVLAPGAELARRLGQRDWISHAIARARIELVRAETDDEHAIAVIELVATIARADPRRGATLLREGLRGSLLARELAASALGLVCEEAPTPECAPPLRRIYAARHDE